MAMMQYGEDGQDILHDACLALYRSKAYLRCNRQRRLRAWLVEAVVFSVREYRRNRAKDGKRYKLFTALEQHVVRESIVEERLASERLIESILAFDPKTLLVTDVRNALGKLSYEDQQLAVAYFIEESTIREIAERTGLDKMTVHIRIVVLRKQLQRMLRDYRPKRVNSRYS